MPLTRRDYLSVQESADLLGCTVGRVRQLLLDGTIEGEKLNERAWAVDRKSVEKYAEIEHSSGRPRISESQ